MKSKGILGNTVQEQLDKAKELLDYPMEPGHSLAYRLSVIQALLGCPDCTDEEDCKACRILEIENEG